MLNSEVTVKRRVIIFLLPNGMWSWIPLALEKRQKRSTGLSRTNIAQIVTSRYIDCYPRLGFSYEPIEW